MIHLGDEFVIVHESLGYGFEVEPDLGNRRMGPKLTFCTKTEEVASKNKGHLK